MTTNPLHAAIESLRDRHGWTDAELQRRSGVAATTLARIREGRGGRSDALAKLDAAFDLPTGALAQVRRGELSPTDVLARLDSPEPENVPADIEFRLRSLESAVGELRSVVRALAEDLEADQSTP